MMVTGRSVVAEAEKLMTRKPALSTVADRLTELLNRLFGREPQPVPARVPVPVRHPAPIRLPAERH